jgi:hypothetical protein
VKITEDNSYGRNEEKRLGLGKLLFTEEEQEASTVDQLSAILSFAVHVGRNAYQIRS